MAIENSAKAFQKWSKTTPINRARILARFKDLLIKNYNVIEDKISRYDKMFDNYEIFDFCWHTKIKLYIDREPVVKFYRTYPHNPFIGYHNYK